MSIPVKNLPWIRNLKGRCFQHLEASETALGAVSDPPPLHPAKGGFQQKRILRFDPSGNRPDQQEAWRGVACNAQEFLRPQPLIYKTDYAKYLTQKCSSLLTSLAASICTIWPA